MVKKMEEFLLDFHFSGEKLYIVHNKNVIFSVFLFKKIRLVELESVYVLLAELFRSGIKNFSAACIFYVVADSLYQMSFTVASVAVYEKWVVDYSRFFYYRLACRVGELVEGSDHKRLKGIARV